MFFFPCPFTQTICDEWICAFVCLFMRYKFMKLRTQVGRITVLHMDQHTQRQTQATPREAQTMWSHTLV